MNPTFASKNSPPGPAWNLDTALQRLRADAAPWFTQPETPLLAVVLGSGLGGLADSIEQATAIPYHQLPGFPAATAAGHRGEFLLGRLAGVRIIAMVGRLHAYEGHTAAALTRGMSLLAALRPDAVILSCAAGGLNPRYETGDLVLIDEHLSFLHGKLGGEKLGGGEELGGGDATSREQPTGGLPGQRLGRPTCDSRLAAIAEQTSQRTDARFRLHRGTYLAVNGPNYETRAECRMMRGWGADLVGMSTVPELVWASRVGLPVLGIAVVTNMAIPDAARTANHDDVLAVSNQAGANLQSIVQAIAAAVDPPAWTGTTTTPNVQVDAIKDCHERN